MLISWLAFLAFLICMGYVVWDTMRPKRVKWHDKVDVLGNYECIETIRRAKAREALKP